MTAAVATVATATATTGTVGERDANNQLQKVTINLCRKKETNERTSVRMRGKK